MRSINKVILIGNLTRNPEMRQTPNGQNVTTFGIATNREWNTKEGDRKNSAEFHECVAWAKLAEICDQYLIKGHLVYIEGYLKTRSWDSPEGVKKFKTEIVVKDMIRLEKRPKGEEGKEGEEYVPETESTTVSAKTPVTEEKAVPTEESPKTEETPSEETATEEAPKEEIPVVEETPTEDTPTEENPIDKALGL